MHSNYWTENPFNTQQLLMADKVKGIYFLHKAEYDLIKDKDPLASYVIIDTGEVFYGTVKQAYVSTSSHILNKYFLTISDSFDQYIICLNYAIDNFCFLVEIERYNNLSDAFNALKLYNTVSSHRKVPIKIKQMIDNFEEKTISYKDLIYGIIGIFGFKNDPKFMQLINTIDSYLVPLNSVILPNEIPQLIEINRPELVSSSNFLFDYFYKLLDLFKVAYKNGLRKKLNQNKFPQLIKFIFDIFYSKGRSI